MNILFIVSRLPINLETGDRVRVYYFIKQLVNKGHKVDIIGFVPSADGPVKTDISALCGHCEGVEKDGIEFKQPSRVDQLGTFFKSFAAGYPFRAWLWRDEVFMDKAKNLVLKNDYDVIHFSGISTGLVFDELDESECRAKFVIDLIDSVAMNVHRSLKHDWKLWPFRLIQKRRLKKHERSLVERADEAILISERDKHYLGDDIEVAVIPNGVSLPEPGHQKRDIDLLFTGNMSAEPNIDAVVWFSKKVMPKLPGVTFYIAGVDPTAKVKALAQDNIVVTGYVDDMNEFYRRAKLFVCPMRLGAGQKNKVLEAMANKTPVISTAEGNIGIDAPRDAIAIAEKPDEFVQTFVQLMQNEKERNELGVRGFNYVKNNFYWEKMVDSLAKLYD